VVVAAISVCLTVIFLVRDFSLHANWNLMDLVVVGNLDLDRSEELNVVKAMS